MASIAPGAAPAQPGPPPPPARGKPELEVAYPGLLTVAVMLAMIMQILDTTIANVALPHMQSSLGATLDSINWVLTSYLIATAVAIPITGWLADRFGSRNLFIAAVTGFVLSSMLCGAAANLEQMVLFRFLQGISAAFIGPLSQTVMIDINAPEDRAKAMAIWGMGVMVGPIMGPVLGGWLTENYEWRWVFYVNVPFGIVTLGLLWALLPSRPQRERRFDRFGFITLAVALTALQLMLDRGNQQDWFDSIEIWIELAICVGAAWMFLIHILGNEHGLFERALITNRNLVTSLFFMVVIGVVMFTSMALLPPMLQRLFDYPVIDTGLILAARGLGMLAAMWLSGRLVTRLDPRILVGTGLSIAALSLWMMTRWSLEMDWHPVVLSGVVQGFGIGLVFIPLNTIAFATLDVQYRPDGSGMLNLSRSVGAAIGISLVSAVLAMNVQVSHQDLAQHVTDSSLSTIDSTMVERFPGMGDGVFPVIDAMVNRQALMIGYLDDFWMLMWMTLASVPLALLLRRPAAATPGAPEQDHAIEL